MIGDAPRHVPPGQAVEDVRKEVEGSRTSGVGHLGQQVDRRIRLDVGEPGDLVVEVLGLVVVEDGPRDVVQLGRWPQPGGHEGVEERVAEAVEVEVAEHEQVRRSSRCAGRPRPASTSPVR